MEPKRKKCAKRSYPITYQFHEFYQHHGWVRVYQHFQIYQSYNFSETCSIFRDKHCRFRYTASQSTTNKINKTNPSIAVPTPLPSLFATLTPPLPHRLPGPPPDVAPAVARDNGLGRPPGVSAPGWVYLGSTVQ